MKTRWVAVAGTTFSAICIAIGVMLAFAGTWLMALGGSRYYAIAGLGFLVIGVFVYRRSAWSFWLYAVLILGSLIWALSEVGLDWWQLFPRGNLIVVLGLMLIVVSAGQWFETQSRRQYARWGRATLIASLLVSGAVAIVSAIFPRHDSEGNLPQERKGIALSIDAVAADKDWAAYGGTNAGNRFSTLDQITTRNVDQLQVAWTFHTGDLRKDNDPVETTFEVTPLKVGDTVYLCTAHDVVFALDAETGQEKWRFDPQIRQPPFQSTQHLTCRGVSFHDGSGSEHAASAGLPDCVKRIFLPTVDGRLIALSAADGRVCPGFGGPNGTVDLWQNMPNRSPGAYYSTSPPVVTNKAIIVGGAVNDNVSSHQASGVIRAFDVDSGALIWNWDSQKPDQTRPIESGRTYSENSPNSWSISSYDPKLDLIYIPMGNQSPDQFGGGRSANVEKYSSSVVALNATTGEVRWVFQSTHHDLWDMDVPAQPSLLDLTINGEQIPALIETTKQGELFVLDRRTGTPILPVREMPAPQGAVDGDHTTATQPVSAISFNPEPLTEASMWGLSLPDQLACRIKFRSLRYDGRYTPPSLQGSIIYPGNVGVFNWGGIAVDPERKVVFAMPVYLAFTSALKVRHDEVRREVTTDKDAPFNENFGSRYAAKMAPFFSPIGKPCQAPPWGFVAGVDLEAGKIAYKKVNGTVRDLTRIPLPFKLGVPGIGGPLVTRGGVAFLTGTVDYFARAYDVTTGQVLWESRLPAGGQASPMTYWSDVSSRQFVVVAAGGHGSMGTKAGDSVIAYALPIDKR